MAVATPKNLHVPLPPKLYRALRAAAEREGRPATQVAREAIALWLRAQRRRDAEVELRAYVEAMSGTAHDLDEELAAAAEDHLAQSSAQARGGRRRK